MKTLFILPVRSGSQRIINKNIQKIGDKTLIEIALLKLSKNDEYDVLISSDSLKYIQHAKDFNNKYCPKKTIYFHQRSKKTSSNSATLEDLLDEIFENKNLINNYNDIFVHQCTSPFISKKTINKIVNLFRVKNLDSIFTTISSHPFYWKKNDQSEEYLACFDNIIPRVGTKNADKIFIETGGIYGFKRNKYLMKKTRTFLNKLPFNLNKFEALDIDDKMDLDFARFLYPYLEKNLFE